MSPTVYLVSGANRGIGHSLVTQLVGRENVIVFAGARDPFTAKDLHVLVDKYPGKIHIVKLVSSDKSGNEAAVVEIKRLAGRLDVVIANAGISNYLGPALEVPLEQMREHYEVNVVGTLALFQATYPLLNASSATPKFIPISSAVGSVRDGTTFPFALLAYGTSKAAENYLARKIHVEYPNIVCFPLHPGGVATDMSDHNIKHDKNMEPFRASLITAEESAAKMLAVIDKSTREVTSGHFLSYTGETLNW